MRQTNSLKTITGGLSLSAATENHALKFKFFGLKNARRLGTVPVSGHFVIFALMLVLVALAPLHQVSAQLPIEGDYPNLPVVNIHITRASSLGEIVQYLTGWALIIASLVAFISLIAAGLLYLTSAGEPGRMQLGKKRITNSVLGLLILLSSYTIFRVVDPQINVMEIKTVPVASGIFLIKDGPNFDAFQNGTVDLSEMLKLGEAKYLEGDMKEITKKLGSLKVVNGEYENGQCVKIGNEPLIRLNYDEFPLRGIAFWGEYGKRAKVVTYSNPKYILQDGSQNTFSPLRNTVRIKGEQDLYLADFKVDYKTMLFSNALPVNIEGVNIKYKCGTQKFEGKAQGIISPPLSLRVMGTGPGIYLYSITDEIAAKANKDIDIAVNDPNLGFTVEEKYLYTSKNNFSDSDVEFNDKTSHIAIKNKNLPDDADNSVLDYLAILHEDDDYEGNLRIYFQTAERETYYHALDAGMPYQRQKINVKNLNGYFTPSATNAKPTVSPVKPINNEKNEDIFFGSTANPPSSLQIFELSPVAEVCEKVKLCKEKNFVQPCLVYNYSADASSDNDAVNDMAPLDKMSAAKAFGLPRYWPVNIPQNEVEYTGQNNEKTKVKFENNIRSIEITGDCLVVLFENPIKAGDDDNCKAKGEKMPKDFGHLGFQTSLLSLKKSPWDTGEPGSRSEVFTVSDSDLSDNRIGNCGLYDKIGFKQGKPCASAIAIYPIKATR